MLDYLKVLQDKEHDAFFFLPGPKEDTIHLEGASYKDAGLSSYSIQRIRRW
jgi:hypothetical protein